MGFITTIITAIGGEAFKAAFTKLGEWWKAEGKLLFIGWYQKRQGKKEQHQADQFAQLRREAEEVSRANQRVETINTETKRRIDTGDPPIFRLRKPPR